MSEQTYLILTFRNGRQVAALYYYNGNFYHPVFFKDCQMENRVRRLIQIFTRENSELVRSDQAHPDYRTKLQHMEAFE